MRGLLLSLLLLLLLLLSGCGVVNQITTGNSNGIPMPSPGQWVVYAGNVPVNSNGSFTFGNTGASDGQGVGYVYTGYSGNPAGKTITMTYTVAGTGTVLPSVASGVGSAQVRLFLWRTNDDLSCSATTEWYREWSATGAGPLTNGTHTISAVISDPGWTDCLGHTDATQLAGVTANLLGVGFTFGAEFYGHGAYSTGSNTFTLNNFTIN